MLRRKVISATIALSGFMALGRGLELVGTLIVARLVAPEAFGIVAAALIVMQLTASLTELNIYDALIQKLDIMRVDYDTAFTFSVLRGLIISLTMLIAAYPVALVFGEMEIVPVIAALSLAQLVLSLRSLKLAEYARRVEPAMPALVSFFGKLVGFVTTVTLAYATGSYWAIVYGLIVGNVIDTVLSYVIAPYFPRFSMKSARWLFSFTGWMNLFAITGAGIAQFDRFYLGTRLGEAVLGIYTLATSVASQVVWSLAAPIMNALFAGLSSIKDQPERLKSGYLLGQGVIVAIMMPIGAGLAIISAPLVQLVLGPDWMLAVPIISIVAPATAFHMMSVGAHALALALGEPKQLFLRNLIGLGVSIPLVIIGILIAGPIGAAWARAATILVIVFLNLQLAKTLLGLDVHRQFANCARSFASCAVMIGVVYGAVESNLIVSASEPSWIEIAALVILGGVAYTATHAMMWFLAGCPDGIERIVTKAARRVFA